MNNFLENKGWHDFFLPLDPQVSVIPICVKGKDDNTDGWGMLYPDHVQLTMLTVNYHDYHVASCLATLIRYNNITP